MYTGLNFFDTHFHIIDNRFPLVENQGFLPEPFTCQDYLEAVKPYHLVGGAIVSGSFQVFDQSYLLDALKQLGKGFVGVTQLPYSTPDHEILELNQAGVRAVRFNLKRGGSEGLEYLTDMALRVYDLAGWHVELYVDAKHLKELTPTLLKLPAVSIDHLGLTQTGFSDLVKLAERDVKVKATGFGRVDLDVRNSLKTLYTANPTALMFGTDLPSTRATRPYQHSDLELITDIFDEEQFHKILCDNAMNFYKCHQKA